MGVICLTDEMKSKALRLLRAAAGRYDKICEAWYAHAGEELDLQLFLDMAEDDCLTYLGTQELPPVVTATTLAKLAFVHLNCFIQDRDYGVKSTSYTRRQPLPTCSSRTTDTGRCAPVKAKTPKSWTVKSRIFSAQTIRDSAYDFEQNTYSASPAVLYLCWQPVSASAPIEERGRVLSAGYQAVLYDPVGVRPGDLVQADGIGWLEVETVQQFLHYRLLTANATERRAPGGNEH